MQSSSQIIDNLEQNIWEVIKDNLSKSESVRFAVWYLFLSWLKDISSKLKDLNEIKILIWNKTDKSTLNELIEEDNKLFTYSAFIKELKDLKNNNKELYNKIKKLPLRVRTAKWWNEKNTLVFCKHWIYEYFYISNSIWNIINNKWTFLKLLKSDINDKRLDLHESHDVITNNIENFFYEEISKNVIKEEFSKEKKIEMDIASLRNKIIKFKEEILTKYDNDLQDKCDEIVSFLWNKMEAYEKRKFKEFKKVRKPEEFNEDIINDMYELVKSMNNKKKEDEKENNVKEKVIVISESII